MTDLAPRPTAEHAAPEPAKLWDDAVADENVELRWRLAEERRRREEAEAEARRLSTQSAALELARFKEVETWKMRALLNPHLGVRAKTLVRAVIETERRYHQQRPADGMVHVPVEAIGDPGFAEAVGERPITGRKSTQRHLKWGEARGLIVRETRTERVRTQTEIPHVDPDTGETVARTVVREEPRKRHYIRRDGSLVDMLQRLADYRDPHPVRRGGARTCPHCGKALFRGARVCHGCGAPLRPAPERLDGSLCTNDVGGKLVSPAAPTDPTGPSGQAAAGSAPLGAAGGEQQASAARLGGVGGGGMGESGTNTKSVQSGPSGGSTTPALDARSRWFIAIHEQARAAGLDDGAAYRLARRLVDEPAIPVGGGIRVVSAEEAADIRARTDAFDCDVDEDNGAPDREPVAVDEDDLAPGDGLICCFGTEEVAQHVVRQGLDDAAEETE